MNVVHPMQPKSPQNPGAGPQAEELDEDEIIRRVVSGHVNTFEVLVKRYRPLVFRIVLRHIPRDSVEDVAQEVFVRAYQSLPNYGGKGKFSHWLTTIATRGCCDFWRGRRRNPEIPLSSLTEEHQKWLDDVLAPRSRQDFREEAGRREGEEVLQYALERLSPEDRMVLSLVHLEGISAREAAAMLDWSVIKTKVRAHRARRQLRGIILEILETR